MSHSQEKYGLIFLAAAQSRPHPARKLLRSAHGAAFRVAIGTFGGRAVRVDSDIALGRETGDGKMAVEARRDVTDDICVVQGLHWQSRYVLLRRRCRHLCDVVVALWPKVFLKLSTEELREAEMTMLM